MWFWGNREGTLHLLGCRNSYHNLGGLEQQKLLSQCRGQIPKSALLAVGGNPGFWAHHASLPPLSRALPLCLSS